LVRELAEEKKKVDKKYSSMLVYVKKFTEEGEKNVIEKNLAKMKETVRIKSVPSLSF
jgi:hypothetical protein